MPEGAAICGELPTSAPIAIASSAPDAKRSSGPFARQRSTSASTSGGIPGRRLDGTGGASVRCFTMISPTPSASNGGRPHTSRNRTQPSA
jgi:hypothetical protein